jgi:hypothetical protein
LVILLKSLIGNNMNTYDKRHGGAWDRGGADSYYSRGRVPHYYVGDTAQSPRIMEADMTAEEIEAYHAGYDWNEQFGGKKEW